MKPDFVNGLIGLLAVGADEEVVDFADGFVAIVDNGATNDLGRTVRGSWMTEGTDGNNGEEDGGAGGTSLAGYEYQIDVSVWLALDLVLANKLTHEMVLEPATQEDIEAELAEYQPGRVTSNAHLADCRLVVQAKLRTGDAWTVAGVKALLKHGDVRESAAKRLSDARARYLLVTSAALNGGTRGMRVRQAGNWPNPAHLPASIRNELPSGSAGLLAVGKLHRCCPQ
jgi:hypothetical protein